MRCAGTFAAALLAAAACDAQVDAEYAGEPLLALSGVIVATADVSVETLRVRWATDDPAGPGEHESRMRVERSSLNRFAAELVAEPHAGAWRALAAGEPRFAEGIVVAFDAAGRTVGADVDRVVVWLERDVAAGTLTAALFGGPLAAGYHAMTRGDLADPPPARAPLVAACVERGRVEGWDDQRADVACRLLHAHELVPTHVAEAWVVQASRSAP